MMRRIPLLIRLRNFVGITACLLSINTFGQEAGFLRTDLISPSPTASQLAKYGEVPVTYYTGLPNVSIPIFNVTGNELSLPITLTYNYSGAQPGQRPSWVGLGWSLQAGGVITRTVGDRLDDSDGYDKDSVSLNPSQAYLKRSRYFGMSDNMPDVYSFNFGSYSGKFIVVDGEYYIMPKQKLIIGGNSASGWTIVTEDGTKYRFEAMEYTTAKPVADAYNIPQHASSYYLTKITNATDTESISLTYEEDGTMEQVGVRSQSCKIPTNTITPVPEVSPPGDLLPTRVTIQRLKSITSDKYSIEFTAGSARQDVRMLEPTSANKTYPLAEIEVSSKDGVLKIFQLETDYFPGTSTEGKALRLRSVTEHAGGGRLQKHTFEYYNESQSIGSGISAPVDRFGYLRSGVENGTLISNELWAFGVDRTPDFSKLVNGALKTITYPTGGSTTFTYELNRYNDGDHNIIDNQVRGFPAIRYNPSTTNLIYGIDTFRITHEQYVKILFTRSDKEGPYDPETDPAEVWHDNTHEFEIRPVDSLFDEEDNFLYEAVGMPVYQGEIIYNADNDGKTDSVSLDPGRYIIKTICDDHELEVTAIVFYKVDTGVKSPGVPGPGLRLQSLVHNNGFGKTLQKEFSYVKENGHCSGVLLQGTSYRQSSFKNVSRTFVFDAAVDSTLYNMYTSTVASIGEMGLPLYYARVVDDSKSGDEVHSSAHAFLYFGGTQNAELVSKTEYAQAGEVFTPLSKDEFTFSTEYNYGSLTGLEIYNSERHTYVENNLIGYDRYGANPKNWVEYWKYTKKSKQTRYEKGQELVTETRSYYDHAGTRNLTGTKTTLEDGSTLFTKYKYPEDYSDISEIDELVAANILTPVIEEQVGAGSRVREIRCWSAAASTNMKTSG